MTVIILLATAAMGAQAGDPDLTTQTAGAPLPTPSSRYTNATGTLSPRWRSTIPWPAAVCFACRSMMRSSHALSSRA